MKKRLDFMPVAKLLEEKGLEMPAFPCISSDPAKFSLLKMQPQADFQYDEKGGPRCADDSLTKKCRDALQFSKKEYVDLLLFPEYCMPYSLLEEIISDLWQWPDENKLWCLPCQAVPTDDFFAFLSNAGENEQVILLDKACHRDPNRQLRFFVNALFYCFTVRVGDTIKLVLLPQLKLHPMSDPAYLCEGAGLSTGGIIYYFEGENICLFSLICADVYHADLSWGALHKQFGHRALLILHPQMNSNPREQAFSRLRRDMMEQNEPSLYITCNWAAGTKLRPLDGAGGPLRINLSWSCIYRKYDAQISVDLLYGSSSDQASNLKWGLCTGVVAKTRTVVWFTDSREALHILRLEASRSSGYPVANRYQGCQAVARYTVAGNKSSELCWELQEYAFCLADQLKSLPDLEHLWKVIFSEPSVCHLSAGGVPFRSSHKDEVDHFFALTSTSRQHTLALDGMTEVPAAWTLFLSDEDVANADRSLDHFIKLCGSLEMDLPPHLQELQGRLQFVYLPREKDKPPANLQSTDAEHRRMLVAFAETEYEARRYLYHLMEDGLCAKEPDGRFVCIFYQKPLHRTMDSIPKAETHINNGSAFQSFSSITNGGVDD